MLDQHLVEHLYCYIRQADLTQREKDFVRDYYGIGAASLSLRKLGALHKISAERVRQILCSAKRKMAFAERDFCSPYEKARKEFASALRKKTFLSFEELLQIDYFKETVLEAFDHKGFIAFLNDCGISHVQYLQGSYFFFEETNKRRVVSDIKQEKKFQRRLRSEERRAKKISYAIFVPEDVREKLLKKKDSSGRSLNNIYEDIFLKFVSSEDFDGFKGDLSRSYIKGKKQVGISIKKEVFETVSRAAFNLEKKMGKRVRISALMAKALEWGS